MSFHYFGIKDIEIDGQSSEDDLTDFNYLISSQKSKLFAGKIGILQLFW